MRFSDWRHDCSSRLTGRHGWVMQSSCVKNAATDPLAEISPAYVRLNISLKALWNFLFWHHFLTCLSSPVWWLTSVIICCSLHQYVWSWTNPINNYDLSECPSDISNVDSFCVCVSSFVDTFCVCASTFEKIYRQFSCLCVYFWRLYMYVCRQFLCLCVYFWNNFSKVDTQTQKLSTYISKIDTQKLSTLYF